MKSHYGEQIPIANENKRVYHVTIKTMSIHVCYSKTKNLILNGMIFQTFQSNYTNYNFLKYEKNHCSYCVIFVCIHNLL